LLSKDKKKGLFGGRIKKKKKTLKKQARRLLRLKKKKDKVQYTNIKRLKKGLRPKKTERVGVEGLEADQEWRREDGRNEPGEKSIGGKPGM